MASIRREIEREIKSYFSLKFERYYFTDKVTGRPVNIYIDCYEVEYMKNSRWSFFKVRKFY